VVAFIIVSAKTRPFKMSFEVAFILKIMKKSYPFALLMVLMSVYYRIDSVMLERMLPGGNVEAGIYAQAFRILDAFTMFAFLFATLLLPMYSRMIRKGNPVEDLTVFSFMILIRLRYMMYWLLIS
jgi:O-antigen/teichoic acid export membrane protein